MILRRLLQFPRRALGRTLRGMHNVRGRAEAAIAPTFAVARTEPLARRFESLDSACLKRVRAHDPRHPELVRRQAQAFRSHCFDLLGSGPVVVAHGVACRGLAGHRFAPGPEVIPDPKGEWLHGRINRGNLKEAQRIWALIGTDYQPIDWQLDFKSGFRWSERTWHRDIHFGDRLGADVKVPWELARMQHLPVLALAAHYANAGLPGFEPAQHYSQEIRHQILDFIATNPPQYGVNWYCSMDVGIRVANMLVAKDLLSATGVAWDVESDAVFAASVRSHGRHVAANLEWAPRFRGNHYLANLVGLLFCAVYLPRDEETDLWLHFASTELLVEIDYQFHPDGSNFEASVCYHRLSAEMVIWGLALLDGLTTDRLASLELRRTWMQRIPGRRILDPMPLHRIPDTERRTPVPQWCRQRVASMMAFTRALTRPDGCVTQFGDNDSGRFIVLAGSEQLRADGNPEHVAWSLDHCALLAAGETFLGRPPGEVCSELLVLVARWPAVRSYIQSPDLPIAVGSESEWNAFHKTALACADSSLHRSEFITTPGLINDLQFHRFPGMGCYVIRSARLYIAIRCGEIGLHGLGAHAHCDQLAIELWLDGEDRVRDPGTYLYTPLPQQRNQYRSANAHHVPRSGEREPANLERGVFDLRGMAEGECLYFGRKGFVGRHAGYGRWMYRSVAIEDDRIVILDFSPDGLPVTAPDPKALAFSQGYGRLISTQ